MTRVNSKVKIHVVDELFVGDQFRTDVWISEAARKALAKFTRRGKGREFAFKVRRYAKDGFDAYSGAKAPIRRETLAEGVWRIGPSETLFRLIGFYDGLDFIVIDAFMKRGTQLSDGQRKRIIEVARVRAKTLWRKRES